MLLSSGKADNNNNIGSVFLVVDSLLLFVMCTVTLQRLRDSVTQIYTFIIIIIIIITMIVSSKANKSGQLQ